MEISLGGFLMGNGKFIVEWNSFYKSLIYIALNVSVMQHFTQNLTHIDYMLLHRIPGKYIMYGNILKRQCHCMPLIYTTN